MRQLLVPIMVSGFGFICPGFPLSPEHNQGQLNFICGILSNEELHLNNISFQNQYPNYSELSLSLRGTISSVEGSSTEGHCLWKEMLP